MTTRVVNEAVLDGANVVVAANSTDEVISEVFLLTNTTKLILDVTVTSVSVPALQDIEIKFQDRAYMGQWFDKKTATFDADGTHTIKLIEADSNDVQYLPLRTQGRIVMTTGTDETATVTSIVVITY